MGSVAVDINNMVEVNAVGLRALSDALGDDGARVFINQFKDRSRIADDADAERRRVAASRIAVILELAEAAAEAGRGKGDGNATKEKYERPEQSFDEVTAELWRVDAEMRAAGEYQS